MTGCAMLMTPYSAFSFHHHSNSIYWLSLP
jgi:hypothetical protein